MLLNSLLCSQPLGAISAGSVASHTMNRFERALRWTYDRVEYAVCTDVRMLAWITPESSEWYSIVETIILEQVQYFARRDVCAGIDRAQTIRADWHDSALNRSSRD